jgi:hypothetical protein
MTQASLLPAVSDDVHSYLLEDELLLFSEHSSAIYRLNSSAALIWCCLEEGLDQPSVSAELAKTYGLPASKAETVVTTTLSEWKTLGLVGQGEKSSTSPPEVQAETPCTAEIAGSVARINGYQSLQEHHYRLLESVFSICLPESGLEYLVHSVFAHLEASSDKPVDIALEVQKDTHGYTLFCNGKLVARCTTEAELAPLLHAHAAGATYSRAECLIAIHAAAISNGKECIVLPAKGGNGKSTLTGALIGSGFQYCTDELVLLKHQTHTVQAIPVAIALKPGSWPVLNSFYPELESLPVFLRPDGKRVRYLLPPKQALPENASRCYPVHSLVYPIYQQTQNTGLVRISPADALCRLTEAGYDMEGGLNRERVEELVGWISGISCYELRVNDLQEAVSLMKEFMP